MKSIKQQYIDLQEGRMSQSNFMRNLRMSLPQYITNVTSFNDSVKILRNKGILSEADEKGKWTNANGKSMYDQFKELDNLNGHEVVQGIDWEMQNDPELTKDEATKVVLKNLKKNPLYYTMWDLSGIEGAEAETMGPKADIEARQMQYLDKNMGNVVDKKMGMQPVKGIEKPKKDSDKATAEKYKTSGIDIMSLIAKTVRGVKKMNATGEKMKKVTVKENKVASTIFDKNANTTKGLKDIAKGEDNKKKLTKEYLMQMIQEELNEMFDGMEPMDRTGLDEASSSVGLTKKHQDQISDLSPEQKKALYNNLTDATHDVNEKEFTETGRQTSR